jgi:uncharacterized membrane protein YphA (DoxX/SURF4 family)
MYESIPHLHFPPAVLELPLWKWRLSWLCAVLLAVLFSVSGLWKLLDPLGWSARIVQLQFTPSLALPATLAIGIAEVFAGGLILAPRFRRWGAALTTLLLVVFMIYVGANYSVLRGEECSCFPWLKRSVGPGFFVGDALMIAAAVLAGLWTPPSRGLRAAFLILTAISVFGLASLGFALNRQDGLRAPDTVTVEGKPFSLGQGRVFLYFFDPECMHCFHAAQRLSRYHWKGVRVVGVPTRLPQFSAQFQKDTGWSAPVTTDVDLLRKTFTFTDPPYGVALEVGRQRAAFVAFDETEPEAGLRAIGWLD